MTEVYQKAINQWRIEYIDAQGANKVEYLTGDRCKVKARVNKLCKEGSIEFRIFFIQNHNEYDYFRPVAFRIKEGHLEI